MRGSTNSARVMAIALGAALAALTMPSASQAAAATPHWLMSLQAAPTDFHPGDERDFYEIVAVNDGGAPTTGPVTLTTTLPAGLTVNANGANELVEVTGQFDTSSTEGSCEQATSNNVVTVTCTTGASVPVGRSLLVNINVSVPVGFAPGKDLAYTATIAGGGAAEATAKGMTPVTEATLPVPFGASLVSEATESSGVDTQAGSHPFAFTTIVMFNAAGVNRFEKCNRHRTPACAALNAQPKDVEVALPAGLIGNPTAVPYCTHPQFEGRQTPDGCPPATQVGGLFLYFYAASALEYVPVYNIEPPSGQPVEFGFTVGGLGHIPMFAHVRTDGDYGLTTSIPNINQFAPVRMAFLSIWGNPSDPAHNPLRLSELGNCEQGGGCASGIASPKPYLTMPTSCTGSALEIPAWGDSWQEPERVVAFGPVASIAGMTGCEALSFHPSITVSATNHQAGAPAGYSVGVQVPQNEEPGQRATPDVRDVEVTLPAGTTLSPSAANGLSACSAQEFGLKVSTKGNCPSGSLIGSVTITTPLLEHKVVGSVYVGEPECSPCSASDAEAGRMARVLIEAEAQGVIIKQAGHTKIDQATGQLTTVFKDTPQLPFSSLELSLEPGSAAPLENPTACAPAVTTGLITPWNGSTPTSVEAEPIPIEGCSTPGFSPSLQAGTTPSAQAGASTGFTMALSRNDREQPLGRVSVTTPPGVLGVLKSVEQCPEPQANAGTCGAGSLIGTGTVVVGPGSTPLTINGGKVYLTGPYAGKSFGLSIVTPAVAGPFVLAGNANNGNEVVRASIALDPHTGALTVASDPLPQQLNGVPLNIRTIHVDINRKAFMFNPTNCNAMKVAATVTSATGTVANASSPFQTVNCAILPFKPTFTATTQARTSKHNGASLRVHVTSGAGQANIAKVKVDLPIQLPSRLSTLQKACVASVFESNPAGCPAASVVGSATAVTPLLAHPLTGPSFLVSHAGAAFPDLETVLQGEGITLILDGNTHISKGITSSVFKAIPDAPINTFDLVLPEGPHSALAAFGNLCTSKLNMPTVITGQNGAVIKQTTRITATGCPKHKSAKAGRASKKKS